VQKGLTWDLGDKRELGQVSLRVPQNRFMLELVKSCGLLAVASAARAGMKPARELFGIPALQSEIAAYYDVGEIAEGLTSTIIEIAGNEAKVQRIGAISLAELQSVDPNIDPNIVLPS
jgi:tRNA A37 threonylcarbamoyladenosine synthetase subunit TsaC/SUA5/YrdC